MSSEAGGPKQDGGIRPERIQGGETMMDGIPRITQVALVVADLQATMEAYHRALGWGPWNVYEHGPPAYQDLRFRGEPVEYSLLGAETQAGPVAFELIQPLAGPSPFREWLDTNGDGLHHVACMVDSKDEAAALRERFEGLGIETLTSGRLGEDIDFYFFDTEPILKMILETGSGHSKELVEPIRVYP